MLFLVLPSLDAATQDVFEKINSPVDGLSITRYIQGLIDFRNDYKGKIWLEVFILPGYNDNVKELMELKNAILKIKPDSVQLNTLDRPGNIPDLKSATRDQLQQIRDLWKISNVEIISASPERKKVLSYRKDTESAIVETISRRPCTLDDLTKILGIHVNEINKYLSVLDAEEKIEAVKQERGLFYQLKRKK